MPSSVSNKKRKLSSISSSTVWAPSPSKRRVSRIPGVLYSSISVASDGYDEDEDDSIDVRSENDEDNSSTSENDAEDNESCSEQLALWRRDPKESFSDWTIEVTYEVDHVGGDVDSGIGEAQKVEDGSVLEEAKKTSHSSDKPPENETEEAINQDGSESDKNSGDSDNLETQTDTYNVHRCIMAAGGRKSGYFARLFKNSWTESKSRKSVLRVDRLAAKFFPAMLDYIYYSQIVDSHDEEEEEEEDLKVDDKTNRITLSPENVTALWWLAQYFEVPKLAREAKRFWQHDLGAMVKHMAGDATIPEEVFWSACITYYEHARALQVEPAGLGILAVLSTHLVKIPEKKIQLNFPDEGFWMSLMNTIIDNAGGTMSDNVSLHLSKIFGTHFANCPLNPTVFRELTQSKYLPKVHRGPAVLLLEMERGVIGCLCGCESEDETKEEAERPSIGTQTSPAGAGDGGHEIEILAGCRSERTKSVALGSGIITTQTMHKRTMVTDADGNRIINADTGEVTCLQRRCIESMAQDWKTFDDIPDHDYCLIRNQTPSILLYALLEFAKAAENEVASLRDAIKQEEQECSKFVRAPNNSVLDPNLGRRSKNDTVFPSGHIGDSSGWYIMQEDRLKYAMYYYDSDRSYDDLSLNNPSLEIKEGSDVTRYTEGQRLRAKLVANFCIDPVTRHVCVPVDGLEGVRAKLIQRRLLSTHDDARDSAVLTGALSALTRVAKDHVKELKMQLAEEKSHRNKFVRAQSYSDVSQGRAALLVSTPISFPPAESPSDGWCLRRGSRPYPLYYYKWEQTRHTETPSK